MPPEIRIPPKMLVAILIVEAFALIARSWLQIQLGAQGFDPGFAADLAYLVVPPILILMLLPVWRQCGTFLLGLLRRGQLTLRLVLTAIAIGVLMRIAWWSQLIARVAFGVTRNDDPQAVVGPTFGFDCPPLAVIGLGIIVMAFLVPLVEETICRGLFQSAFVHRGKWAAILVSAIVFTVFHNPSSFVFVFFFGIVFGIQFWNTGTLWPTLITHATYNGILQFDWRCLRGTWNPDAGHLPLVMPGAVALTLLVAATTAVFWIVSRRNAGAP